MRQSHTLVVSAYWTGTHGTSRLTSDGQQVTLATGTDSATTLYWNRTALVWNNGGDTITVTNADGARVLTEVYG